MNRSSASLITVLCFGAGLLPWQAAGVNPPAKQISAETILDRYVQVTGGPDLYRRYGFYSMYSTVTRQDRTTFNSTVYHSRDGSTHTEIDADPNSSESGISNGIVWEYSEKKGAKILKGKIAARRIAEARGLDADDWRVRFPSVKWAGAETISGKSCYHLRLTQTDGSVVERFYDTRSGLLIREISTDFDEAGVEQPVTMDIEEYYTWLGITHPSLIHVKTGATTFTIRIDSLTYAPARSQVAFDVPREVVKAVAESRGEGALPNAVDLVERYIEATGGKEAYRSIRTEMMKAEISFTTEHLKFPLVLYATGAKRYTSLDIPSLGKFESGSDGSTAWEKSVVLGPKLEPRSSIGGFLGPNADDVLRWTDSDLTLATVGKDEVNGSSCYKVNLGGQAASTVCFDVQTGLLTKATDTTAAERSTISVETIFSDYQAHGAFKAPHHIETKVAGQQAVIEIKEMAINGPLPSGVFDLPPDVQALKEKKLTDLKNADVESKERPTLRRGK